MIEIIKEEVEMPEPSLRRFRYGRKPNTSDRKEKWQIKDTLEDNQIIYENAYQDVAIACFNLNKKYYRDLCQK